MMAASTAPLRGLAQQHANPSAAEPVLRPAAAAREILERYDVGPSQLEMLLSGQPLSPAEEDVLVKILYHFPRLGLENIARWRERTADWDKVAAAPAEYRAKLFLLRGRAKRVEQAALLPEQSRLYELKHYYRVTIDLDDSPYEAIVAVRDVPAAWPVGEPIDERTECDAMFLKVGAGVDEKAPLLFVGQRVGWLPDQPEPEHHVAEPQLALANLGMDISLWDAVRASEDHALTAADREAFYRLLSVVGQPQAADLSRVAAEKLNLVALLEKSAEHLGEVLPVAGTARRITKVQVGDADVRARFGFDHYYEIDLFLPLAGPALRLGNDPKGEKNAVFHNTFPATLIVRRLPPGLAEGENLHETVRADGVFFKTWTYRSKFAGQFGQLQPAPLFIAAEPQLVAAPPAANSLVGSLVTTALVLSLVMAALAGWWFRRSDRSLVRRPLNPNDAKPDFSGLRDR
jgi:hypothetical protein